jgi:hypothetical protein
MKSRKKIIKRIKKLAKQMNAVEEEHLKTPSSDFIVNLSRVRFLAVMEGKIDALIWLLKSKN